MRQFVVFFAIFLANLTGTANAVPLKYFPSQSYSDAFETFELDENNLPRNPLQEISHQKSEVGNTEDIIQLLLLHSTNPEIIQSLLTVLEIPEVRFFVDRILLEYPELPRLLKSLGEFFKGTEAKALTDAIKESVDPVMKTLLDLYDKIKDPVEKALEELMVESIRLFFRLQNPQVVEVLRKLQDLPEVHELAGYLIVYNIDLVRGLQRLENLLNGGGL